MDWMDKSDLQLDEVWFNPQKNVCIPLGRLERLTSSLQVLTHTPSIGANESYAVAKIPSSRLERLTSSFRHCRGFTSETLCQLS